MLQPLPSSLGPRFLVAAALESGVTAGRLRRGDVDRPFHGVRVRAEMVDHIDVDRWGLSLGGLEAEHMNRARSYAVRMGEEEFFSHVTAAVIWGLPLPAGRLTGAAVHVSVFSPHRLHRSKGIAGHEAAVRSTSIQYDPHTRLRVSSPSTTWAMLGALLHDPRDLVAAGDAAVRQWRVGEPLTTLDRLNAAVESGRRVGIQRLRDALPLIRTSSASRPETWLRLILCDDGLPEPALNFDIFQGGVRLACVDLAYPAQRVAIEYEGEHHLLNPAQWARDIRRYEVLEAAGWKVIRITKDEVFKTPEVLLERVRRALRERP